MNHLSIIEIISLPRNIFRSRVSKTSSKTCILIAKRTANLSKRKIIFASAKSIDELSRENMERKISASPDGFLYPEFYLEQNQILTPLPKLKEFEVEIIQGSTKYGNERWFSPTGIPFISAKTITPTGLDFSKDKRYIEAGGIMDNTRSRVNINDIVFVRVGVGCIGRVSVITNETEMGIADDWVYIIRNKDFRLSPFYLAFWLQTSIIQKEIKRLARGVGTLTIPVSLVKELPIFIPNSKIMKECEEKYKKILFLRSNKHAEKAFLIKEVMCEKLENFLFDREYENKN